jgi:hypothetical protein
MDKDIQYLQKNDSKKCNQCDGTFVDDAKDKLDERLIHKLDVSLTSWRKERQSTFGTGHLKVVFFVVLTFLFLRFTFLKWPSQ